MKKKQPKKELKKQDNNHFGDTLIDLVTTDRLWVTLGEIADLLGVEIGSIRCIALWAFTVWVDLEGQKAELISYRDTQAWLPAVEKTIDTAGDFGRLYKLRERLEEDFVAHPKTYTQQVQQKLEQRWDNRHQEIFMELWQTSFKDWGSKRQQALAIAQMYLPVIATCRNRESIELVGELIEEQYPLLEDFPHLLNVLRCACVQRLEEVQNNS